MHLEREAIRGNRGPTTTGSRFPIQVLKQGFVLSSHWNNNIWYMKVYIYLQEPEIWNDIKKGLQCTFWKVKCVHKNSLQEIKHHTLGYNSAVQVNCQEKDVHVIL